MVYHRISTGFVAAALLALQFQGARAETAPKVIEEVDFAISCGPGSQQAVQARGLDSAFVLVSLRR